MIQLKSFENRGTATFYVNTTLPIDGGSVMFHRPFIPLGGGPAITPRITVGGMIVSTHLDHWHPMWIGDNGEVVLLPMTCSTQEYAAGAARAFAADPAIVWNASEADLTAWCHRYIAELEPHAS